MRWLLVSIGCATKDNLFFFNPLRPHIALPHLVLRAEIPILEVCYLAGTSRVNAGVSHYGVWKANFGREITNPYPMKYFSASSSPLLALHGEDDGTQRLEFVEQAWDEVKSQGGRLATHIYAGADHAWDRIDSKKWDYNEEVDKDSHKMTIEFFKKHLE